MQGQDAGHQAGSIAAELDEWCIWTAKLIGNLVAWVGRYHGETECFSTQLLSGYETFQSYLHNIGSSPSSDCVFFNRTVGDADQTYFLRKVGWDRPPSLLKHIVALSRKHCQKDVKDC